MEYGTAFDSHGVGVTTLGSFARDFLAPSNAAHDGAPTSDKEAYVSQHPIFHQIPELQSTFTVIPYTLGRLRVETSAVNLWLGRAGGVAPCHYDGYHNAFAQLHGRKRLLVATPNPNPNPNPSPSPQDNACVNVLDLEVATGRVSVVALNITPLAE